MTICKREAVLNNKGMRRNIFTRAGLISISFIIQFILLRAVDAQKRSIESAIFFLKMNLPDPKKMPSRPAVTRMIKYFSFEKLRYVLLSFPYKAIEHNIKLFHGMKVYIVDGTKAILPRNAETLKLYGCQKTGTNTAHYPQMHILCLVELGTNFIKSFAFGALKSNEKPLLLQALDHISKGSLILGDCGFHSAGLAWKLTSMGFSFLIRMNESNSYAMLKKLNFVRGEIIIDLKITKEMRNTYPGMEDAPKTIRVRIIKVRDSQDDRRAVYLMTCLMEIPKLDLAELYFERQRVEDNFKYKKCYGGLEKIHPNTGVHMMNLAILGIVAYLNTVQLVLSKINSTPSPTEKGEYTLNRKATWENLYSVIFNYFSTGVISHLFYQMLERTKNKIRPGRIEDRYSKQPINQHTRNKNIKKNDTIKRKAAALLN
jgi:hypothetical protein